jgi:hypothetical protein
MCEKLRNHSHPPLFAHARVRLSYLVGTQQRAITGQSAMSIPRTPSQCQSSRSEFTPYDALTYDSKTLSISQSKLELAWIISGS